MKDLSQSDSKKKPQGLKGHNGIDSDIQKLFDLSDQMKAVLVKLEKRRSFDAGLQEIIADCGKSFRFFRCCYLSALRYAVDDEYRNYIDILNKKLKTKNLSAYKAGGGRSGVCQTAGANDKKIKKER